MPQNCCVPTCGHTESTCLLKRFPRNLQTRRMWENFVEDPKLIKNAWKRICQCHFDQDQFVSYAPNGRRKLKPNAVPLLFPKQTELTVQPTSEVPPEAEHMTKTVPQLKVETQRIEEDKAAKDESNVPVKVLFYNTHDATRTSSVSHSISPINPDYKIACRCCLLETDNFENLSYYKKAIMECVPFKEFESGDIPQNICNKCIKMLETTVKFRNLCTESNKKLKKYSRNSGDVYYSETPGKMCITNTASDNDDSVRQGTIPPSNSPRPDTKLKQNHTRVRKTHHGHQCGYCRRQFKYKYELKAHRLGSHDSLYGYVCEICLLELPDKRSLELHSKTHARIRTYTCSTCLKKFSRQHYLRNHETKHETKPFACEFCSKQFLCRVNLHNHKRIHSRELVFTCDFCDETFAKKDMLVTHRLTHADEKSYKCKRCNKRVPCSKDRHKFLLSYASSFNFVCKFCTKRYKFKPGLQKHMMLKHIF